MADVHSTSAAGTGGRRLFVRLTIVNRPKFFASYFQRSGSFLGKNYFLLLAWERCVSYCETFVFMPSKAGVSEFTSELLRLFNIYSNSLEW